LTGYKKIENEYKNDWWYVSDKFNVTTTNDSQCQVFAGPPVPHYQANYRGKNGGPGGKS